MTSRTLSIADRISEIRRRIRIAAVRSGRDERTIRLVAVTKGVPLSSIAEAIASGLTEFGENKIQEATLKMATADPRWNWHFLGRLQSNKVRAAVGKFALIQSVDTRSLGEAIDVAAKRAGVRQRVLVQVNLGNEPQKGGVTVSEVPALWAALSTLSNLSVEGLMTIPPFAEEPEASRPYFRQLHELGSEVTRSGPGTAEVLYSMGMSHDFEIAIEEGATMVRIGTAIFGGRPPERKGGDQTSGAPGRETTCL